MACDMGQAAQGYGDNEAEESPSRPECQTLAQSPVFDLNFLNWEAEVRKDRLGNSHMPPSMNYLKGTWIEQLLKLPQLSGFSDTRSTLKSGLANCCLLGRRGTILPVWGRGKEATPQLFFLEPGDLRPAFSLFWACFLIYDILRVPSSSEPWG